MEEVDDDSKENRTGRDGTGCSRQNKSVPSYLPVCMCMCVFTTLAVAAAAAAAAVAAAILAETVNDSLRNIARLGSAQLSSGYHQLLTAQLSQRLKNSKT